MGADFGSRVGNYTWRHGRDSSIEIADEDDLLESMLARYTVRMKAADARPSTGRNYDRSR